MEIKIKSRLSFGDGIWAASAFEPGQTPKFGASFLVPKSDKKTIQLIEDTILAVANEKWPGKGKQVIDSIRNNPLKFCFQDGEQKADKYEGYAGHMVISAINKQRPAVVDRNPTITLVQADGRPYSGCYVVAKIDFWAQDNKYGKGIRAQLNVVQFDKDGDAFSGGAPIRTDDLEDLSLEDDNDYA